MDYKQKSYMIFFGFVAYVVILLVYWNNILEQAKTSFLMNLFLYYLTNPAYILLVYGVIRYASVQIWRKTMGSILLIVSLDLVSSPRVVLTDIATSNSMILDNATLIIKWFISHGFTDQISFCIIYLIAPIILFWLSMELLGYVKFINKLNNGI